MAGKMKFVIDVESRDARRNVDNLNKEFDLSAKKVLGLGAAILGAKKAFDFIGGSIQAASDAMETNSKLGVVFAGQLEQTSDAVKDLNDNYGFSITQAEKMLATTGDLLSGFGFAGDAAFDMSVQVQKLAADTASFSNIEGGAARASEALTALILGQTEKAKALGIVINQGSKEFKDQVKAMQESKDMTLVQAKAVVLLEEATRQSHNAIGDFSRTQDSFANQQKMLTNTLEDLRVEFGKVFVQTALPILKDFAGWVKDNKDLIVSGFEGIGKAINFIVGPLTAVGLASQVLKNIDIIADSQKSAAESMHEYANRLLEFRYQAEFLGKDMSKLDEAIDLFQKSTGDANQKFSELNAIWADIKSGEFGQHVADQFKVFNAEYIKNISIQKEGIKSTKESTNAINSNTEANKGNSDALKDTNVVIPDTIELNDYLSESLRGIDEEMENLKRQQSDIAAGFEFEYNEAVKNSAMETAGAAVELTKLEKIMNAVNKIDMSSYFGAMSKALDVLGKSFNETNKAFNSFKDIAGSLSSGDYFGAIVSGLGFIGNLFGKEGVTGQVEAATKALEEFGITGEETIQKLADAYEDLLSSMSMADLAKMTADDWKNLMNDMEDMAEEAAKGSREWFEPMEDAIAPLNDFLAGGAANQQSFNDQVNITLGTFANLMKSGKSITEVLGMMDDSFDQLIASQQKGQYEGNALFNELAKFRTLIKDNEALVKSVEGFNALLGATAGLGEITQDQLTSFAREASQEFEKLKAAGFSENQALQMLAPSLKTLEENAAKYGNTLDANTQKLIDQAREAGAFDDLADPMDTLLQVMVKIGDALGADMSEFSKMGETAEIEANKAADSFDKTTTSIIGVGDAAKTAGADTMQSFDEASISIKGVGDAAKTAGSDTIESFDSAEVSIMKTGDSAEIAAQTMTNAFKESSKASTEAIDAFVKHSMNALKEFDNFKGMNLPVDGYPGERNRTPGSKRNIGFQSGTAPNGFMVPDGFPNDSYQIGASTGEVIFVGRPGTDRPIDQRNNTVTIQNNITVSGQSTTGDIERVLERTLLNSGTIQKLIRDIVRN